MEKYKSELNNLRESLVFDIADLLKNKWVELHNPESGIDWAENDNIIVLEENEIGTHYVEVTETDSHCEVTSLLQVPINRIYVTNDNEVTIGWGENEVDDEVDLTNINTDSLVALWESLHK